jgi:hypothetical protein
MTHRRRAARQLLLRSSGFVHNPQSFGDIKPPASGNKKPASGFREVASNTGAVLVAEGQASSGESASSPFGIAQQLQSLLEISSPHMHCTQPCDGFPLVPLGTPL